MSLSTRKRREKLSYDPNNTTWSKSTGTYGHRILSAQGWKQGDYLGAQDANHSGHYTAANSSHIKVLLREENLGLGAQLSRSNAETFGLSLFSGVLGRLNGRSDVEVQRQQSALRDAELRTYQARKYGLMNFVSGGFLVGDRLELAAERDARLNKQGQGFADLDQQERKTKKRKVEGNSLEVVPKTKSRSKKRKVEAAIESDNGQAGGSGETRRKKRKEKLTSAEENGPKAPTTASRSPELGIDEALRATRSGKSKSVEVCHKNKRRKGEGIEVSVKKAAAYADTTLKQEKCARKEERQKRKEEQRRSKSKSQADPPKDDQEPVPPRPPAAAKEFETFSGSRLAVRQRYIHQKRMASLDPRAMKEIFMIKAVA